MSKITYEIHHDKGVLKLEATTNYNHTECVIVKENNVRVVISSKKFNKILADANNKKFDIFRYDE